MGQAASSYICNTVTMIYNKTRNSSERKRKYSDDENEAVIEESLHIPKKRKMICTTRYIYQTLFIDGRNHDIVIEALGKTWKLHKLYLTQSPYFQSMFSGSWKETNTNYIKIEVLDPNINVKALSLVLGSLYQDEVIIEPAGVVGVLAAATLFQMEGVIDNCLSIMVETISQLTAISYYEASIQYGLQRIKNISIVWFVANLMTYYPFHTDRLRQIGSDLMNELVNHKDLCVIPAEFALYNLLKLWAFLKLHPHWQAEGDPDRQQVMEFFQNRPDSTPFLLSPEGKDYLQVFQGLRVRNLLVDKDDMEMLIKDRILPEAWIAPELKHLWSTLLGVVSSCDTNLAELEPETFLASSIRLGRVLESKDCSSFTWKWNLFNFGLGLVWSIFNNVLTVRRSTEEDIKLQDTRPRTIKLRVTVMSLDRQRQIKRSQSSGIMTIVLVRHFEARIMDISTELEYPIIIRVNLLSVSP